LCVTLIFFFYIEFIQPICLPVLSHHRSNKLVDSAPFVAGWGSESLRKSTNTWVHKEYLRHIILNIKYTFGFNNAICLYDYYLEGQLSNVLMETQVPVIDNAECKRAYYLSKKISVDDSILCAGSGGKDACHVLIKIFIMCIGKF